MSCDAAALAVALSVGDCTPLRVGCSLVSSFNSLITRLVHQFHHTHTPHCNVSDIRKVLPAAPGFHWEYELVTQQQYQRHTCRLCSHLSKSTLEARRVYVPRIRGESETIIRPKRRTKELAEETSEQQHGTRAAMRRANIWKYGQQQPPEPF